MHPAALVQHLGGLLRFIPVTQHDAVAARAQFTGLATGHDLAFQVDDLHFGMRKHSADRRHAPLDRIAEPGLETDRTGLGHAIGDRDIAHVHPVDDLAHHLDRTWRAGHDSSAQRGEVEAREFWMLKLGNEHRRHAVERGAFLLRDRRQRNEWIKPLAGINHGRTMGHGREVAHHHTEAMIERHRDANAVVLCQRHRAPDEIAVVEYVVMRERDALG